MRLWSRTQTSHSEEAVAPVPPSEAMILEALRPIVDPDFGRSIVELGFVKDIAVDGDRVSFAIELTTPACPVKAEFERTARERVLALEGVSQVDVTMTAQPRGRRSSSPASDAEILPGVSHVMAVASGKGGVGKSTTAVNLALALRAAGARVGLMDADVYGPSLPLLTGVRGRPRVEDRRIHPHEVYGIRVMSMGFLTTENTPVIWRGPMVHGLVRQFLTDVAWGELDYLVVDMPPGTGGRSVDAHAAGSALGRGHRYDRQRALTGRCSEESQDVREGSGPRVGHCREHVLLYPTRST